MIIWREGEVQSGKRRWARAEKRGQDDRGGGDTDKSRGRENEREEERERDKK